MNINGNTVSVFFFLPNYVEVPDVFPVNLSSFSIAVLVLSFLGLYVPLLLSHFHCPLYALSVDIIFQSVVPPFLLHF